MSLRRPTAAGREWGPIGIGLPNWVPGCPGRVLLDWAAAAEGMGFGFLATIDRLAYPTHDPLTTLAAAAAVTERIGLLANVVVGPTRNATLLAKQSATLQAVSAGRFVLGLGAGDRTDDFELAGAPFGTRGRALDDLVVALRAAWAGESPQGSESSVVPDPLEIPVVLGGHADRSIARAVRLGEGWTVGGLGPEEVAPLVGRLRGGWAEAGREGEPLVVALAYYVLGRDVTNSGAAALADYYSWYGRRGAETDIVAGLLRTPEAVQECIAAFSAAGVDHVVLCPTVADIAQVNRLADTLGWI